MPLAPRAVPGPPPVRVCHRILVAQPFLSADFPVVYASGIAGIAGPSPDELADDLEPLFDVIVKEVSAPSVQVRVCEKTVVTGKAVDGGMLLPGGLQCESEAGPGTAACVL